MHIPQKSMVEIEIFIYNLIENSISAIKSDKKDRYTEMILEEVKKY